MVRDRPNQPSALVATFTFPPDVNGVAEASRSCARILLDAGWRVEVATAPAKTTREEMTWRGANVYEFDVGHTQNDNKRRAAVTCYQKFLKAGSWDVIVFEGYGWPLQLAVQLLPKLKAKKVLVSHGYAALRWFPVRKFPFGLGHWARSTLASLSMLRWVRYIDRWVFLSHQYDFDAFFDHTLARLIRHSGIRVIPNGVGPLDSSGTSTSFRSAHQIQKDAFVFLCVAYYSRGKDQGFAVRAFQQANIPNSVLVFIGTEFNEWSREFQNIGQEVADSHKRRRIVWLEKQSRSDTLAAFRESDAFVLSSHLETQPIAILEAMSLGKPWVGRKAGCIASLPGGICVRTPYSMAQAMCSIARNAELRSELSEEGREAVTESFSQQKYAKAYGLLLKELTLQKESPTQP